MAERNEEVVLRKDTIRPLGIRRTVEGDALDAFGLLNTLRGALLREVARPSPFVLSSLLPESSALHPPDLSPSALSRFYLSFLRKPTFHLYSQHP